MKNVILLGAIILTLFTACEWQTIEPEKIELPKEEVLFSTQIQPIFTAKCISCHTANNPKLTSGVAYSSLTNGYINTTDPAQSKLYTAFAVSGGKHYEKGILTATEIATILKWIEEGAKNN